MWCACACACACLCLFVCVCLCDGLVECGATALSVKRRHSLPQPQQAKWLPAVDERFGKAERGQEQDIPLCEINAHWPIYRKSSHGLFRVVLPCHFPPELHNDCCSHESNQNENHSSRQKSWDRITTTPRIVKLYGEFPFGTFQSTWQCKSNANLMTLSKFNFFSTYIQLIILNILDCPAITKNDS